MTTAVQAETAPLVNNSEAFLLQTSCPKTAINYFLSMRLYFQGLFIHKSNNHIYIFFLSFFSYSFFYFASFLLSLFLSAPSEWGNKNFFQNTNCLGKAFIQTCPSGRCCRFVVSLFILFTTKANTLLSPFHQILTKDLIHTWLNYTTKRKILLKNSPSSRWKSCEFLLISCCRFPTNVRMWEGIVSEGDVTVSIKSGIGLNEFLFVHGFVFWARVGGGSCVMQFLLCIGNVCTTEVHPPAFCPCNYTWTLWRQVGVRIVSYFELHMDAALRYLFSYEHMT